MNVKEVVSNVGYCGLICSLCHESDHCNGCKSNHNCCGRHLNKEGCFQYRCCAEKNIDGCWQCEIAPCTLDMFSEHHDIRNRVFIKIAKAEGIEKLVEYVLTNHKLGVQYGWNKDYDNLKSEEEVISLLHKSRKIE